MFAALNADPEVMRHFPEPLTREQSDGLAERGESWLEREGLGLLPVVRRADGACLGMCGLHRHRWYSDDVEVGWRLARHAWGHGYATEAASRWLERAFGDLALPRVISVTTPDNDASTAVMRRLGMVEDHRRTHDDPRGALEVVVHVVTAGEWAARRSCGER